jgi:hypothetical protein
MSKKKSGLRGTLNFAIWEPRFLHRQKKPHFPNLGFRLAETNATIGLRNFWIRSKMPIIGREN